MRSFLPSALLALILLPSPADAKEAVDCSNARNTVEINACAETDYKAADDALNDVYRKVLAHIADSAGEAPYDRASWEKAMREAQRAWVAFRDSDCKGAVPMEWSGGTGTTAAVLGCMTEKTAARTSDLKARYGLE